MNSFIIPSNHILPRLEKELKEVLDKASVGVQVDKLEWVAEGIKVWTQNPKSEDG